MFHTHDGVPYALTMQYGLRRVQVPKEELHAAFDEPRR